MKEVWKDIPQYEGLYQASNLGRIRSLYNYKRNGTNILVPKIKRGYYQIGLRKEGIRKWHQVQRLIAEAFISNPDNLPQVNHKNENKLDNRVDNLEWCSVSYNNCYGTRIQRVKDKVAKPILQFDLDGNFIKQYSSLREASKDLKIHPSNISHCATGKYKTCKGYIWKYKSEVMPNVYG